MARWIVWRKGQVIAAILLLMAMSAGAAVAVCGAARQTAPEQSAPTPAPAALAVFADAGGLFVEPTPAPTVSAFTVESTPTAQPTNTNIVEETLQSSAQSTSKVGNTPASTPDLSLRVEIIRPTAHPQAEQKSILIYHTHTYEAYAQEEANPYAETEKWRTKDTTRNVVAVGNALTATLRALGYNVTHDFTAFEPPDLDGAYARSLAMLEKRGADGEAFDLYIDLHRDAYIADAGIRQTVSIGGVELARVLILVGKGSNYAQKPNVEANRALGEMISAALNREADGLSRGVSVKSGRYNQHVADKCVLLECGNNRNRLEEVTAMIPYLAQAIDAALQGE